MLSSFSVVAVVVGFKANYYTKDLDLWVVYSPWGVFPSDPSRIHGSFGENHGKVQTARSTSATED